MGRPFMLKLLRERAMASPGLTFKVGENDYRLTFTYGKNKVSYLLHKEPFRMFSIKHYDWRYFVRFTNMRGQNDYVLIEEFNDWLSNKIKTKQIV